ncbi:MAG TPA: hypothetical protein PL151_07680 [Phycisphaerae bacterium]|nr:hypothetical protein [Phycisphaerae bacterium]HOJ76220.1 hypothetical protein [Phycisphaerae bacterium]HOM53568.1 hypothetical protein [Phycisphaerae bacterium]HON66517.1 hypothetical protein [Phycisphaerae bacterium]HOQ88225.1 hypothetical protein [Phycisphaerae bacterium]
MFKTYMTRVKMAALSLLTAGVLFGPGCGMTDLRDNVVAGSLGFVKNYTTDVLETLIPAAADLFSPPAA